MVDRLGEREATLREELERLVADNAETRRRIRSIQRDLDQIGVDREGAVVNRLLGLARCVPSGDHERDASQNA